MKPTLVLLHRLLNDERVWAPVALRLRGRAYIRIPILRRQDNMAQMSTDAWAEVSGVPADTPLVLADFDGRPCGPADAGRCAAARGRAGAGRQLECRPEPAENIPVLEALIAGLQRDFGAESLTLLRRGVHADRLSDVMLMLGCQHIMRDVGADAAVRQIQAIIGRADHRAMLAQLDLPTLVLCGRVDQVTPLALSREAAALIPGARLQIVEDAGHWTPLEQPAVVADQLERLLDRV